MTALRATAYTLTSLASLAFLLLVAYGLLRLAELPGAIGRLAP